MKYRILTIVLAGVLSACAVKPPSSMSMLPQRYTVDGRVSVHKAGQNAFPSNFSWTHELSNDRVDISNGFGQVLARIEVTPHHAAFFDAEGKERRAEDIGTLSERELGWDMPAHGLKFWLLGLADPDRPASWEAGDTRILHQDGWDIRFPDAKAGEAPSRIFLSRPGLDVRIALYNWQLGQISTTSPAS
ncbi:outer membrane lipoprotein LolB [Burkholderiaceae bacterium DAT-1]|nr:outer membrane lipoprotein LolB [Burkholderiaceae bacterium DAT-1]